MRGSMAGMGHRIGAVMIGEAMKGGVRPGAGPATARADRTLRGHAQR